MDVDEVIPVVPSWLAGAGPQNVGLAAAAAFAGGKGPWMQFEVFDRDVAALAGDCEVPMVRVSAAGQLLFNPVAKLFLVDQYGAVVGLEVALLFSAETRTVGVRPLLPREAAEMPAGQRWPARQQRSLTWPLGVTASEFTGHFQVAAGEYPAVLMRGPGPRMLAFTARTAPGPQPRRSRGRGRRVADPVRAR